MTGLHVQVSTAWLAEHLRTASTRIRTWMTPGAVADALAQLAADLDGVTSFPPPMGGPSIVGPPSPSQDLANTLLTVELALKRQPYEPTVTDLTEVLRAVLLTGSAPTRSAPEPPGASRSGFCASGCPMGPDVPHSHQGGSIIWS